MAKKTVATLQKGGAKNWVKVIKSVRSKRTGAYTFEEKMVQTEKVNDHLAS